MTFRKYLITQLWLLALVVAFGVLPVVWMNPEWGNSMLLGLSPMVLHEVIWIGALRLGTNNREKYNYCMLAVAISLLVVPLAVVGLAAIPGAFPAVVVLSSFVYFMSMLVPRLAYINGQIG